MSLVAEFDINDLPKMVNVIGRRHWRVKHREAKLWKNLVHGHCRAIGIEDLGLKKAMLTFTRHSSVEPDADNLVSGFKHVQDGLVQAGVIVDDKPSIIGTPKYLWSFAPVERGKITIKIEVEP